MKNAETILGAETCSEQNLVQRINTINQKKSVPKDIEHNFQKMFEGLGCLLGKHHITVDPSVEPNVHPPRKVPVAIKEKVKQELLSMEKQGVIVQQKEPTDRVNSMVNVIKPNGKLRICMDPKDLNRAIKVTLLLNINENFVQLFVKST